MNETEHKNWNLWLRQRAVEDWTYSICCAAPYQSMCRWVSTSWPWVPRSPGFLCRCTRSHNPRAESARCGSVRNVDGGTVITVWLIPRSFCLSAVNTSAIWLWHLSPNRKSILWLYCRNWWAATHFTQLHCLSSLSCVCAVSTTVRFLTFWVFFLGDSGHSYTWKKSLKRSSNLSFVAVQKQI